jgi:hypothetical protein
MGRPRESFFQSLENSGKFFPIIGKTGPFFPTIGKLISNHWKTFRGDGPGFSLAASPPPR